MRRIALPGLVALVLAPHVAPAASLCVNPGGTGGCFSGIQLAVDASSDGGIITIAAGTYPELVSISGRRSLALRGAGAAVTKLDPGRIETVDSGRVVISDLSVLNGPTSGIRIAGPFGPSNIRRSLVVERCIVSGHPGDGIAAGGYGFAAKVVDSLVTGTGTDADADHWAIVAGHLILIGSTVADNGSNGIMANTAVIDRSTITGNVFGVETIVGKIFRSTIVDNRNIGVLGARVKIGQTILAGNHPPVDEDCRANLVSRGFNLIEFPAYCASALHPTDIAGVDPVLAPLAENGGATPTRAPQPGSPAIAAIPIQSLCRKPDQRGVTRTAPCDIGAYEAP